MIRRPQSQWRDLIHQQSLIQVHTVWADVKADDIFSVLWLAFSVVGQFPGYQPIR
jgi:hypothetical protein